MISIIGGPGGHDLFSQSQVNHKAVPGVSVCHPAIIELLD